MKVFLKSTEGFQYFDKLELMKIAREVAYKTSRENFGYELYNKVGNDNYLTLLSDIADTLAQKKSKDSGVSVQDLAGEPVFYNRKKQLRDADKVLYDKLKE